MDGSTAVSTEATSAMRSIEADALLRPGLGPVTREEIERLAARGLDVATVDPEPRFELSPDAQSRVSRAIAEQSHRGDFADWLFNPQTHPAGSAWRGVAKRAIALHTLYHIGTSERPHDGIGRSMLDEPMFRGGTASARDLIIEQNGQGKGDRILAKYDDFFAAGPTRDHEDEYGLTSRDYLLGVTDSHAVRTRADAAKALIREQFAGSWQPDLRIVSVACGAAEAMYELMGDFAGDGVELAEIDLVDHDPLALAAFASLGRSHGLGDRVRHHRKNFLKTPLDRFIPPNSVDVVDLIGVFEHIPATRAGYHFAANLLTNAAGILRSGGVVVLANMLPERPQQPFFSSVWPPLHQRSISEMLRIFRDAGFDPDRVAVRVPEREGVYAVYLAEIEPDVRAAKTRPSALQRAIGRVVMRSMPEF